MNVDARGERMNRTSSVRLVGVLVVLALGAATPAATADQRVFDDPVEAALALIEAGRADDAETIAAILGDEHPEVYRTEDAAADRESRAAFVRAADTRLLLQVVEPGWLELVVGEEQWPLPIPLVKEEGGWRFDTAAGAEEIVTRRVGRNELLAIELCRVVIRAQEEYRDINWDGDRTPDYAARFKSTPGERDGLYWKADVEAGETPSPLHDFLENQADYLADREQGTPWRGYRARLLTRQGPSAPDGAMDYEADGRLMKGYALVLWPAEHGSSGVMTFMVSHHGVIYEKDLGPETAGTARAMEAFDPDDTWEVVE
jgi:hypothetical protein